jgi:hypothetical protein
MLASNGRLLPWVLPFDIKASAVPWNKIIIAGREWLALPDLGTLVSRPISQKLTPAFVPQLCTPGMGGSVYSAIDRTILRQPFRFATESISRDT